MTLRNGVYDSVLLGSTVTSMEEMPPGEAIHRKSNCLYVAATRASKPRPPPRPLGAFAGVQALAPGHGSVATRQLTAASTTHAAAEDEADDGLDRERPHGAHGDAHRAHEERPLRHVEVDEHAEEECALE